MHVLAHGNEDRGFCLTEICLSFIPSIRKKVYFVTEVKFCTWNLKPMFLWLKLNINYLEQLASFLVYNDLFLCYFQQLQIRHFLYIMISMQYTRSFFIFCFKRWLLKNSLSTTPRNQFYKRSKWKVQESLGAFDLPKDVVIVMDGPRILQWNCLHRFSRT